MALTYQGDYSTDAGTSSGGSVSFHSSTGDLTTDTGELILAFYGNANGALTSYSGTWNVTDTGNSSFGWDARWRISTGSSEATETIVWSSQATVRGYVAVSGIFSESNPFRGVQYTRYIGGADAAIPGTMSWAAPSVTGGVTGDLLVCVWIVDNVGQSPVPTFTAPGGMTEQVAQATAFRPNMLIATKELSGDGATGTQTATTTGTGGARAWVGSFLIASTDNTPPAPVSTSAFKAGARF